ncbi:MAG: tRNA-dihydrouridine synthase family protein [Victivallaceae bacterium]|nr:tRNA-dihydrouridine synthase family protein [Victivallaceae bacterium]
MNRIYPENSLILAPLSGYTDLPYRRSARRFGCRYCFTEMIDAASLAYGNAATRRLLDRGADEEWLGVQLVGSHPERIGRAAEILNQHDFDVLDFNLGCPVAKVVKKGAGAVLGEDADAAAAALELITNRSRHPVTAKIRILSETDPEPTLRLIKKLIAAGAQAITVHGRIRSKFYSGPVHFDIIAAARETAGVQIIANGGVTGASTYAELRGKTGCDTIMAARGAIGNPWLFRELAAPENYSPPAPEELSDELERHLREMMAYYGETRALRVGRKVVLDYLRGRGFPGHLKERGTALLTSADFAEFMKLVRQGPAARYRRWQRAYPEADRRLA